MQDYKSLCAEVTIRATLVNIQVHALAHQHTHIYTHHIDSI